MFYASQHRSNQRVTPSVNQSKRWRRNDKWSVSLETEKNEWRLQTLKSIWLPSGISERILHSRFLTWFLPYFYVHLSPENALHSNQQKWLVHPEKRHRGLAERFILDPILNSCVTLTSLLSLTGQDLVRNTQMIVAEPSWHLLERWCVFMFSVAVWVWVCVSSRNVPECWEGFLPCPSRISFQPAPWCMEFLRRGRAFHSIISIRN